MSRISTTSRINLLYDLMEQVYGGKDRMFVRVCKEYVAKQQVALKDPNIWAFQHGGMNYYDQSALGKAKSSHLHPSLVEDFERDIEPWESSGDRERALIKHLFISTLNAFSSYNDLKIIFPESLHWVLEKHLDLFSSTQSDPMKAMKWKEDRMDKYVQIIHQNMAFSLIIEK